MSYSYSKLSSYIRSPYTAPSSNSSSWKSTPLTGISLIEQLPYERYSEHVPGSQIEYLPIEKRYKDYLEDRRYFQDRYNDFVAVGRLERKEQLYRLDYYNTNLHNVINDRQKGYFQIQN
ncbi:unnamed protein product [Paramecium sonneborni]|uniref:Uncharacterized protein n=1 Tax=Paramecium sonneborni TaxID=65129 RepID=A0A8S1PMA5_9CILI|nr:unnamed protein product [Paramecium sonneborni]